jgi:hypothetical protein
MKKIAQKKFLRKQPHLHHHQQLSAERRRQKMKPARGVRTPKGTGPPGRNQKTWTSVMGIPEVSAVETRGWQQKQMLTACREFSPLEFSPILSLFCKFVMSHKTDKKPFCLRTWFHITLNDLVVMYQNIMAENVLIWQSSKYLRKRVSRLTLVVCLVGLVRVHALITRNIYRRPVKITGFVPTRSLLFVWWNSFLHVHS